MAITSKGFAGGPMTDDDFGAIAARGAWVESAAALAVTQPNTGTRIASIAAGTAVAHGVRAVNDAAISQALTTPGSGGQWYLLVLRRDWTSGVKTTTLQVLAGASTGSTTAPTAVPTSLPATFQSAVGTAQADQPLAWVWVSSASTTLTIFDLRMIDQRNRVLQAASLSALQILALIAAPVIGAVYPCADGIVYRYASATAGWQMWDFPQVPVARFGLANNGGDLNSGAAGLSELNVAAGQVTFNFALYRSAGMSLGVPYYVLTSDFRPSGTVYFGCMTENSDGTSSPAVGYIDNNGGVFPLIAGGKAFVGLRGTAQFRRNY